MISDDSGRKRLKLQLHAEADAVPRSHQQNAANDIDAWQQATPAGQADSPGTGQQQQQYHERAGAQPLEEQQGSSCQQGSAANPSQDSYETTSRLQTFCQSNTQATSATLGRTDSPSQAIGYDDYLDSHHGADDDSMPQEVQLEPQTDPTARTYTDTNSSFSTDTAAGSFAQARTWLNSLQSSLSSKVFQYIKEERKYFMDLAKGKGEKERQAQYISFALSYLGGAAVVLFCGAVAFWVLYFGGRKLAAALCQPSFYLCWVGVAVIGILTPQNPRNNELLNFLSNSNFFANYGQAKTFLNVLTYMSVGLLFAGLFMMGLA